MNTTSTPGVLRGWRWWLLVGFVSTIPVLTCFYLLNLYAAQFGSELSNGQETWGQLGDFIGGTINPLVSWMTLVVVLVSIRFTLDSLKLSRDEFDNAIRQQQEQKKQQKDDEKRQRTFEIWQLWNAPDMMRRRHTAQRYIQQAPNPKPFIRYMHFLGRVAVSPSSESEKVVGEAFLAVFSFIADLAALHSGELLDEDLLFKTITPSLDKFIREHDRISFSFNADQSPPMPEADYLNGWYSVCVAPFLEKCAYLLPDYPSDIIHPEWAPNPPVWERKKLSEKMTASRTAPDTTKNPPAASSET